MKWMELGASTIDDIKRRFLKFAVLTMINQIIDSS